MPEGVEVEIYRRAADTVVGRTVVAVDTPDPWMLKRGLTPTTLGGAVVGERVTGTSRRGKLLALELTGGRRVGLRFGMTGRLVVDGVAPIEQLEYAPTGTDAAWDRFALRFDGGGEVRLIDPRRLGGVELGPDVGALGPDLLTVTLAEMQSRVFVGAVAVKARLLDQGRLAGVGNLIADEVLWRAGIAPDRPAAGLTGPEQRRLHRHLRALVPELLANGGSHTGRLQPERSPSGHCPRDGAPLDRRTIAGRTTYSCGLHQA
ncbi:MAG: DNA-formamidopyrimidine glycosylase family protein [Acidimicrobiales bacterium]